jgi:hypothetical protein
VTSRDPVMKTQRPRAADVLGRCLAWLRSLPDRAVAELGGGAPTFFAAVLPLLVLAAILYTRSFRTNFIFDEQEALLANPYVNGNSLSFFDVVHRDFWGLPADRSVGSYRPLPNIVWRLLADALRASHHLARWVVRSQATFSLNPWLFHWFNVVVHAVNGALLASTVYALSRKRDVAWLAGLVFTACAVLTEAVSGVVGTADVLGGLGALLAVAALRLPLYAMPLCVLGALLVGFFSKESAIVCVPLVPLAALWLAPFSHPKRPLRAIRFAAALAASAGACILYVELRKYWFHSALPPELSAPLPRDASVWQRSLHRFLVWFHQPALPKDPLNNPLVQADTAHRVAGALRVWARDLGQILLPKTLSGDYSFRAEPVPDRLVFSGSVLGALGMVVPVLAGIGLWVRALVRERIAEVRSSLSETVLVGVGLVWLVVSFFPHSNILLLLPTVRAERFLYFPAIGSSIAIAAGFAWAIRASRSAAVRRSVVATFVLFIGFQCVRARMHALDYADDLVFWGATKDAAPLSAKAHLNYSVMWGARGRLDIRLEENRIAADLAPKWPMAHIYLGDTFCRLHKSDEAWPHYVDGFKIADNEPNLIALALQCLWDENAIKGHEAELTDLGNAHPGSWLDWLAKDILVNGEEHKGVDPKYRPRGYNEGPKE